MDGYVQDFLRDHPPSGHAPSPAAENLRDIDESPLLDAERKSHFHTATAKLLYLAKRVRTDLLVAVSYFTTRVQCPNESDGAKLDRTINYLADTASDHITLSPPQDDPQTVVAYVDASYSAHVDGKGHTGCIITLGGGPIYCRSSKQKSSSKSSTEAELIALADSTSRILWCIYFLEEQGHTMPAGIINRHTTYQDNFSTIGMLNNGRPKAERSLHIKKNLFWFKDVIDEGLIKVTHLRTELMTADLLTKPKQGLVFRTLKAMVLGNCSQSKIRGVCWITSIYS